jgi:hypothetical protein
MFQANLFGHITRNIKENLQEIQIIHKNNNPVIKLKNNQLNKQNNKLHLDPAVLLI